MFRSRADLMGQWHWLKGRWHEGDCTWILREAPTPWGPWTTVATKVWDMYHDYYFPVFAPKFVSSDGLHLYVFTAGWGKYTSILYRLTLIPLDLRTGSSPLLEPAGTSSAASEKISRPHEGLKLDNTKPGVVYQYYASPKLDFDGGSSQFSKVSRLGVAPDKTGVCARPALQCIRRDGKFFVHFEGYFVASYPGDYTFFLNSQDGSRLTVAEELVVDNDGYHAPYEQAGTIRLGDGLHRFVLDFFQASDGGLLEIGVRVPGQPRRSVEAADLVHLDDVGDASACNVR